MSYGARLSEMYRKAADVVDKIFKGANPADIPMEQPTRLELYINLKTAKALGLEVPQSLLARADEVIECVRPPPLMGRKADCPLHHHS